MDHAKHVVAVGLAKRVPRKAVLDRGRDVLTDALRRVEEYHVDAGHHDLLRLSMCQVEDVTGNLDLDRPKRALAMRMLHVRQDLILRVRFLLMLGRVDLYLTRDDGRGRLDDLDERVADAHEQLYRS